MPGISGRKPPKTKLERPSTVIVITILLVGVNCPRDRFLLLSKITLTTIGELRQPGLKNPSFGFIVASRTCWWILRSRTLWLAISNREWFSGGIPTKQKGLHGFGPGLPFFSPNIRGSAAVWASRLQFGTHKPLEDKDGVAAVLRGVRVIYCLSHHTRSADAAAGSPSATMR